MSLDSMHKKLIEFPKRFIKLKQFNPRAKIKEKLKLKVLNNAGNLFNTLYYVHSKS